MKTKYDILSEERKAMQSTGDMPEWWATAGWQMFKDKYLYNANTVREQYSRIAQTAAKYMPKEHREEAYNNFFEMMGQSIFSNSELIF